ncbi:MAG: DUF1801 domain-containing protein [Flavobacteriales bacterium]|nr:DUF1801 domain-containing protein [Flavobacteriales bacterium]
MDHRAEDYILSMDEQQRSIALLVREIIFSTLPNVDEQYKWKVPMYFIGKPICYISKRNKGIDLAFVRGKELHDEFAVLQNRDTKWVRHLYLEQPEEVPHEAIVSLLRQSAKLIAG